MNVASHAFGLALSAFGLVLLILRAVELGGLMPIISFLIFGLSLILLYAASTFYHGAKKIKWRRRLNVLDHIAIFILIAGTYTPLAMVTLNGKTGWIIFGIIWGIALIGTILKLFFTGRFQVLSTIMYVAMGWLVVFAIEPLMKNLSSEGLIWLLCGGVAYTVGAILFSFNRIKFNHAIFHVFVLAGSFCHFMAIYNYVLP